MSIAQTKDTSIFKLPIKMDDVVIKAVRKGWDVQGFIKRVKTDTTFYKAFRSLHVLTWYATNDVRVYNNKGGVQASLYSKTKQLYSNGCRTMQVLEEKTTGDFYNRKRQYNYYTAELYAYLFFTQGKKCGEDDYVTGGIRKVGNNKNESNSYKLKQLMFNPGSRVTGVPLMGDKSAIFEPEIAKMYDFKLSSQEHDGEDCYVFSAIPKKGYEKEVVYDNLTTWFRKSDYSIVARDYSLSYRAGVYDFDVRMKVRMTHAHGKMVPSYIEYDGNWHVFTKKRERVKFVTNIRYTP
ncbi:hypothetical protein CAP35_00160 [Chitinophagaceae bacterium IBVUCB1]|nr:hypothetical protein CAP35_00160 [Chitinophagaceae bacterium IBVUCB1]